MSTDMSQFLLTFYEESFEGLDIMETGLLNLDVGAADIDVINDIFRAAHSIKGGAATFGLDEVASFTHFVETLLDELRDGRREVTQELVDVLLASVDCLKEMLSARRSEQAVDPARAESLQQRMAAMLSMQAGGAAAAGADAGTTQNATPRCWCIVFRPHPHLFRTGNDPVRILRELEALGELRVEADVSKLPPFVQLEPEVSYLGWQIELRGDVPRAAIDEVFAWVEGDCDLEIAPLAEHLPPAADTVVSLVPAQSGADQAVCGELLHERRASGDRRKGADRRQVGAADSTSIRVNIDKVDDVIDLVGELVITQSMLSTLGEDFDMNKIYRLRDGLVQLERNTRELQESVMRMRMMPISFAFNRFPRMVHDLSAQLGKKVELKTSGENTELDKTVIEKISDPLVHLVRNSLDHGIETPQERIAAGKPEQGGVWLNAYHKGGNIVIEVKDDGRGLDREKILRKAVERGLVQPDTQLSTQQIHDLIFLPGFSTAESVSNVSGRGVGMDVVRSNIRALGGSVEIASEAGQGSCFTVRLPLTLAIVDGQTIAVGEEVYIIPLVSIVESMQIQEGMVNHVAGRGETFRMRDEYLPVIRLHEVFGAKPRAIRLEDGLLVVVEGDGRRVGLFVDELLGQQQVVIKSMETNYKRVEGISGATILGDGSVALILDITGLVRLAHQQSEIIEHRKQA